MIDNSKDSKMLSKVLTPEELIIFNLEQSKVLDEFVELMKKFDKSRIKLTPIENIDNGYIVYNGFSEEECNFLIQKIKFNQSIEFKDSSAKTYRKNLRTCIDNESLASMIFDRISSFLPKEYILNLDIKEFGPFSKGSWSPCRLKPNIRVCKYLNEGFFGPHYDGCYLDSEDDRSFFTLMFYLNEDYEGGETAFLDQKDDKKVLTAIKPKRGMMIFFPQDLNHEGRAVKGEKYIFRTDIMFKRNKLSTSEDDNEKLDKTALAKKYLELAQEFERCNNGKQAIEYYSKAFKTDPDIEKWERNRD